MAALDKIYLNYKDSLEFIEWVRNNDKDFIEEFKESGCKSLFVFFYYNQKTINERFDDPGDPEEVHPICMLPELVDRWILKHQDLPIPVRNELYLNYGLSDQGEDKIREFIDAPLEKKDPRPIGKHVKILSRSGYFIGRNYGRNIRYEDHSHKYYREKCCDKKGISYLDFEETDVDPYTLSLMRDSFWYCYETDDIENLYYPKKKNIMSGISSSFTKPGRIKSLKSAINHIRKMEFPVGTILRIEELRYYGEIIVKITK